MDIITAKILSMVLLGGVSLILGFLPLKIGVYFLQDNKGWKRTLTSVLLCFGGGVLFETSIIHMLPEVIHTLKIEIIFGRYLLFNNHLIYNEGTREFRRIKSRL